MRRGIAFLILIAIFLAAFCGLVPIAADDLPQIMPDIESSFPAKDGWIAIDEPSDWAEIKAGGKYYLADDITFADRKYMPSEENSANLTIDGNNRTITLSQTQKALFSKTSCLTLRNVFIEGDLIYSNGAGMNSPIVQWNNTGVTKLSNVISRVNYTATNRSSSGCCVSGVIVNAPEGSVFKKVMYSGNISVELGAKFSGASGIVNTATGARLIDCVNSGNIRVKGTVSIGVYQRPYFAVGGICALTNASTEFLRCSNNGSIVYDASTYQYEFSLEGQAIIGGIVGYSHGDTLNDCSNVGDISLKEYGEEKTGGRIGGILGYSLHISKVNRCSNSGNILCEEQNFHIGGIIGNATRVRLDGCSNDADITVREKNNFAGGIFGYLSGDNADMVGCSNLGNIIIEESASSVSAGGILGSAVVKDSSFGSIWIENCSNSGKIAASTDCNDVYLGGMLGSSLGVRNVYIQKSTNSGDITNGINESGSSTGGIVGALMKVGTTVGADFEVSYEIKNCINKGSIYGSDRVGGIVGAIAQIMIDTADISISQCSNRGAVTGIGSAGGILGIFNESGYRSADKHYSKAGISVRLCENSAGVSSENIAGGIVGTIWETQASPKVEIISCVNIAQIGIKTDSLTTKKSGGMLGYSPFAITVKDSLSGGTVKGDESHVIGLSKIKGENNFYLAEKSSQKISGAEAVLMDKLAQMRKQMDILVYDRGTLEQLLNTSLELKKEECTAKSWIALCEEQGRAGELLKLPDTELTQAQLTEEFELLKTAIKGLKPKVEKTQKVTAKQSASEEGCGGYLSGGAIALAALLTLGVGFAKNKE